MLLRTTLGLTDNLLDAKTISSSFYSTAQTVALWLVVLLCALLRGGLRLEMCELTLSMVHSSEVDSLCLVVRKAYLTVTQSFQMTICLFICRVNRDTSSSRGDQEGFATTRSLTSA